MSIKRGVYDMEIFRGDTPIFKFTVIDVEEKIDEETGEPVYIRTPVDITEHTITGQVRYSPDLPTVWFEFPIEKIAPKDGLFQIRVTKEISEALLPITSTEPDKAVYDMQIELDGNVFTFLTGNFSITRDVTRGY